MNSLKKLPHASSNSGVEDYSHLPPVTPRPPRRPPVPAGSDVVRSTPAVGTTVAPPGTNRVGPAPVTQNTTATVHPTGSLNPNRQSARVASGTYSVGCGKPPAHTQFKPGQSGNPKGRPKGSKNTETIFREESSKFVEVTENGRRRKRSKRELIFLNIINGAVKGNEKAQAKYLKLDERFSPPPASGTAHQPSLPEADQDLSAADE